jgi:ubiquinone/menaquinone biosynthesis C-methylase UbiE
MGMNKLNLGCGVDIRSDYINMDCVVLKGVDVIHDVMNIPLPFEDNYFDEVLCKDILEHVEYIPVLKDIYRILKSGGNLIIRVPHFTSKDSFADPTHKKLFSSDTFSYFTSKHMRSYYIDFHFSEVASLYLHFDKRPAYFWNILIEPLVNFNRTTLNVYEGTFLRVFPATNLEVVLKK